MATESATTATTAAERERYVAEAIHSNEMEGLSVSEVGRKDAQEYIAGLVPFETHHLLFLSCT